MAQQHGRAAHARLLFDGQPRKGLLSISEVKSESGELDVPTRTEEGEGRKYKISDGMTAWSPLEGAYLDEPGQDHESFFRNWKLRGQSKDVDYIRMDGHGVDIQTILLPDCECLMATSGSAFDGNGIQVSAIKFKIVHYEPTFV